MKIISVTGLTLKLLCQSQKFIEYIQGLWDHVGDHAIVKQVSNWFHGMMRS